MYFLDQNFGEFLLLLLSSELQWVTFSAWKMLIFQFALQKMKLSILRKIELDPQVTQIF